MRTIVLIPCMFFFMSSSKDYKSHCLEKTRFSLRSLLDRLLWIPELVKNYHSKINRMISQIQADCTIIYESSRHLILILHHFAPWVIIPSYTESKMHVNLQPHRTDHHSPLPSTVMRNRTCQSYWSGPLGREWIKKTERSF